MSFRFETLENDKGLKSKHAAFNMCISEAVQMSMLVMLSHLRTHQRSPKNQKPKSNLQIEYVSIGSIGLRLADGQAHKRRLG